MELLKLQLNFNNMAFNGKHTSIREIIYRVKRHPLMADANFSDMHLDILDAIRSIGAPMVYEPALKYIDIQDNRGVLPDDLFYIDTAEFVYNNQCLAMTYAASKSGGRWNCVSQKACGIKSGLTYSIKRNYIYTDEETGVVKLNYMRLAMDEEGYPLIPDNVSLIRALEAKVKLNHFDIKHDMGEIPNFVISKLQQEYAWYIAQAENSMKMPSIDEMEGIKNALVRIIPNHVAHEEAFDYNNLRRVR